jgi:outer membrane receptor protein involved in Fe transport
LSGFRVAGVGYMTADLNSAYRFSTRVDGTLQVMNLGDYYPNDYSMQYATAGRATRAGIRVRW